MSEVDPLPELGNLLFGHPQGGFRMPREDAWDEPLFELMRDLGQDAPYGSPAFENEVFAIRPYYWGDCTCGFEEREAEFYDQLEEHAAHCYQVGYSALHARFEGPAWMASHPEHETYERELAKLLARYNLPYQGHGVHCTCARTAAEQQFYTEHAHAETCPLVLPNFEYKPTGLRVTWYKYALRDSYSNIQLELPEWLAVLAACRSSVEGRE